MVHSFLSPVGWVNVVAVLGKEADDSRHSLSVVLSSVGSMLPRVLHPSCVSQGGAGAEEDGEKEEWFHTRRSTVSQL
jgi:hypothetical protein